MTRRRGFTIIELLVVIGILIILVGIVGYGLSKVVGTSKVRATATTLANLRSMVTELETVTKGLNRQPPQMYLSTGAVLTAPADTYDIWRDGEPKTVNNPEPGPFKVSPGSIAKDGGDGRYQFPEVANTQLVMGVLLQAPGNKKLIEQFSPAQLMEELPAGLAGPVRITIRDATGSGNVAYSGTAANRNPSPPLILDAWGNPIVFVPGGGLYDVYAGDVRRELVKTPTNPGPIRSPDGRPFWASAGPDGHLGGFDDKNGNGTYDIGTDAGYGDDNVYSFEN